MENFQRLVFTRFVCEICRDETHCGQRIKSMRTLSETNWDIFSSFIILLPHHLLCVVGEDMFLWRLLSGWTDICYNVFLNFSKVLVRLHGICPWMINTEPTYVCYQQIHISSMQLQLLPSILCTSCGSGDILPRITPTYVCSIVG